MRLPRRRGAPAHRPALRRVARRRDARTAQPGRDLTDRAAPTRCSDAGGSSSDGANLVRLGTLRTLGNLELDPLVLLQRAVSVALDGREVDKHVRTVVLLDETKPLLRVEPLHCALCHAVSP